MNAVDLSIVIVSWNSGHDVIACLDSLQAAAQSERIEIVLVDNASEDGSIDTVRRFFPQVKLIETGANLGFARAANLGWRQAQGEHVLFLNPDTHVFAGALERGLAYFRAHPSVGVLGLKLLNHDGSLQVSCRNFLSLPLLLSDNLLRLPFVPRRLASRFIYRLWDHGETRAVDWVCGACMFLRRSLLEDIGGLNEAYFMYGEDMDLCYRVRQQGYTVVYYPEAAIMHYGNRSGEKRWAEKREAEIVRAELTFLRKHHGRLSWFLFRALAGGAFLAKAAFFFLRGCQPAKGQWKVEASRYWQMAKACKEAVAS
ncbi:MAG: glycosyltransferase family 2 protein [Deltaproteobacteria bacterium]|nr:glycosyltransferase family 2 protein [Deltaproteobacteria bacterium]